MTKAILIAAVVARALLAQGPEARWAQIQLPRGQVGPVEAKPLSGTEVYRTTQILSDGTHVDKSNTSLFYRDDRGRMRSESPARILIFDPVAGFTYELNSTQRTYLRMPIPPRTAFEWIAAVGSGTHVSSTSDQLDGDPGTSYASQRAAVRAAARSITEELPPQTVCGVPAKGSRVTITIPAGAFGNDREVKVVNERWYSDDLKILLKSSNNDPRYGVTTYEFTQIVRTPPDPALFQVPASYQLRLQR